MLVLNALFPVVVLLAIGIILKRYGYTDHAFLQTSDRLVYHIFFPVMLFYKIGGASYGDAMNWNFCVAALAALAVMFSLSIVLIRFCRVPDFQAGSFAQSCYRFNTYIGVAVVLNSLGEEGIRYFGILISIAIPIINVVAVTTLSWYSQEKMTPLRRSGAIVRPLLANPLIIGCLAGIGYSYLFPGFPLFIDNSLQLIAMVTLPLALLSIGGSLSFQGLHRHLAFSLLAAVVKLLIFPLIGFWFLRLFDVTGTPFLVTMIFFALPTSTAIYVLSSQMQSDTELASSAILVSTLLSFPVLTVVLLL